MSRYLLIILCFTPSTLNAQTSILQDTRNLFFKQKDQVQALQLIGGAWQNCTSQNCDSLCLEIGAYYGYLLYRSGDFDHSILQYNKTIQQDTLGLVQAKCHKYIMYNLNQKKNHLLAIEMGNRGYQHPNITCQSKHNLSHDIARAIILSNDRNLFNEGIAWLDTSLYYYDQCGSGNEQLIANKHLDQGTLYKKTFQIDKAIDRFQKAENLYLECCPESGNLFKLQNNLGGLYQNMQDYDLAIGYYQNCIRMLEENQWSYQKENASILYRNLAVLHKQKNEINAAHDWIKKSEDYLIVAKQDSTVSPNRLLADQLKNEIVFAEVLFQQFQWTQDSSSLLASYYKCQNALDSYLDLRNQWILDDEKIIQTANLDVLFNTYFDICRALGRDLEAMYIIEKSKYLNLLDYFDYQHSPNDSSIILFSINPAEVDIAQLIVKTEHQKNEKTAYQFLQKKWKKYLDLLEGHFISYFQNADKVFSAEYKDGQVQIHEVGAVPLIDSLTNICLDGVAKRIDIQKELSLLYNLLIPKKLSDSIPLIISPHGVLQRLSFAMLQKDDTFLIEKVPITYVKSALIPNIEIQSKNQLCFLPTYTGSASTDLHFAQKEAALLSENYGFKLIKNDQAVLKTIHDMPSNHNIFHLAGHCHNDTENFYNSHLLLSNNEKWDVSKIIESKLNANLLVLSACSTNDGEFDFAEGIRGISYAFNLIGNSNQISTLWPIEDESGEHIMRSFYSELDNGKTVATSLRQAHKSYLQNASQILKHPYFWAGFKYEGHPTQKITIHNRDFYLLYLIICGVVLIPITLFFISRKNRSQITV